MNVTHVTTTQEVRDLADGLLDTGRRQPWGVVSIPEDSDAPPIDLDLLTEQVGDVCRIHTIKTGTLTRELENRLPQRCQVYGGASRIYPTGDTWQQRPEESPLRFVHNPNQAAKATEHLIHDALGMAARAGLFDAPALASVPARGIVQKLLADDTRALVALDNGQYATIVHELTYPDVPLDWIIHEGQPIDGLLDPGTNRLTPTLTAHEPADILQHYPHGTVTLAYVASVDRQSAALAVHPAHAHTVPKKRITSNPLDRVDLLLAPGDVVPVRVIRDEQGRPALTLNDIDDDEHVQPALTLTTGGQPWLAPDRHHSDNTDSDAEGGDEGEDASAVATDSDSERETDSTRLVHTELGRSPRTDATPSETGSTPPKPAPGPHRVTPATTTPTVDDATVPTRKGASALETTQLALEQARHENIQLKKQLARATSERNLADITALELGQALARNRRLRDELRAAREEQRAQRAMLRSLNKLADRNSYAGRREQFDNDDEWMRHEVNLAWLTRLTPEDRRQHPLPDDYLIGEEFTASLDAFDDAVKDKALKAAVDVLTGRARSIASRGVHALRSGDGATAIDLVRDDGARCMRAYIEQNVASARRLHYWVHDDGRIELSRVVTHDDMQP